jgi:hypothetical protein
MLFLWTIIHDLHGFILSSTNLTSLTFFFTFKNLLRINFRKILRLFNVMVAQNLLACDLNITYLLVVLSSVFLVLTHQRKMEKLSASIATSPRLASPFFFILTLHSPCGSKPSPRPLTSSTASQHQCFRMLLPMRSCMVTLLPILCFAPLVVCVILTFRTMPLTNCHQKLLLVSLLGIARLIKVFVVSIALLILCLFLAMLFFMRLTFLMQETHPPPLLLYLILCLFFFFFFFFFLPGTSHLDMSCFRSSSFTGSDPRHLPHSVMPSYSRPLACIPCAIDQIPNDTSLAPDVVTISSPAEPIQLVVSSSAACCVHLVSAEPI